MKAIKKFSDNGTFFQLVSEEEPSVVDDRDVKIKIGAIGICASDRHVLHGAMEMPDGNIVGHEFSGTVVETGKKVTKVKPGDRVVCELAKGACMQCRMCSSGHYELCPEKQPPGWKSQGIYAEYTVQPEFCVHPLPEKVSMNVGALAEPVAVCVYGCIERGKVQPDDFTVIFGMGSIGLLTLIVLLDAGVKNIVCVTPLNRGTERFDLAVSLGATRVLPSGSEIESVILDMNDGWKADCVIDCSGNPEAINQGIGLLNKNGKFIALGICPGDPVPFAYNRAVLNVIEVIFSATSSHESWLKTTGILERNNDQIAKLITHAYPLDEWEKAYEALENRKAIKAILNNS